MGRQRSKSPNARDITEMQEALRWLLWLEPVARRLVWSVAELRGIERLARENGMSKADAGNLWQFGLIVIAHRLNWRSYNPGQSAAVV